MHAASPYPGQGNVAQYGAFGVPQKLNGKARKVNPAGLVGCLFVPWFIFSVVYYIRSFSLQYEAAGAASLLCGVFFLFVLVTGFMAFNAAMKPGVDARILGFLFVASLVAWVLGFVLGHINFLNNMQPFYDIQNLNMYPSVNPSVFRGSQLMDAGQIQFTPGSHLDLAKSVGFKNKITYCVAPIVGGNNTASKSLSLPEKPYYDFWAVGINCCSGHSADFHCGEFSNPQAQSGLRLMNDAQRQYFRLAVQEAEVIYKINAPHPIFMYWMTDTNSEISAYQYAGLRAFYMAVFVFFACQLFFVVVLIGHMMKG